MNFVPIKTYDNYIPAHIDMGRLEAEGIRCWLKNETLNTIAPFLSGAFGGIQLMVSASQVSRALELLASFDNPANDNSAFPS
jgi:hypothetical protein